MKFVMAADLISLTSEASVCENREGTAYSGVPWPLDPQGSAPAASGMLVCFLVSCLSSDVSGCILWSEKRKCLALLIRVW